MQYPLLAKVANSVYNNSVCNMHGTHNCTDQVIHAKLLGLGLPAQALAAAELQLVANPLVVAQYAAESQSANGTVELVVSAWCNWLGLN